MLSKVAVFLFIYLNRQSFATDIGSGSSVNSSHSSGPKENPGQIHDPAVTNPAISYECTSSKQIKIIPTQDITLAKLSVLKKGGSGEACKLRKAMIDNCNYVAGDPVTLLLQEDVHPEVIGGHNSKKFKLSCSDEGTYTVQSAPSGINVKPLSTMTSLTKITDHKITLSLKDKDDGILGASIDIGQEIKLIMAITDPNYVLSPQSCTAKGINSNSYKIWEMKGTCTLDSSVIADKWTGAPAQNTLEIKMYGFYFPTSTHVTIECTTKVCTTAHKSACANVCMTLKNRRRREAVTSKNDTFSYEKSVQVAFDVAVNEAGGVNSAIGILPKKPVYTLMGITLYTVMQLI